MGTLNALIELVGRTLSEWRTSGIGDLAFNARNAALLTTALLAVIAATVLVWRALRGRLPGRTAIALHADTGLGATVFDALTPDIATSRFYSGLEFGGLE